MSGRLGHIHAAGLSSPRLQRVLAVLRENRHRWLSRRELRELCGPSVEDATVACRELRSHGYGVECAKRGAHYEYRLISEPVRMRVDSTGQGLIEGMA
jgi:biotin operon repressor